MWLTQRKKVIIEIRILQLATLNSTSYLLIRSVIDKAIFIKRVFSNFGGVFVASNVPFEAVWLTHCKSQFGHITAYPPTNEHDRCLNLNHLFNSLLNCKQYCTNVVKLWLTLYPPFIHRSLTKTYIVS